MNDFELAKQKGVHGVEAKGFMSYSTDAKGKINVDYDATVKAMARDAALQTPVSVGVPSVFTTFIDPQVVPILFAAQNATKIFGEERKGDWTDNFFTFPVEEYAGNVTPYSDFAENVSTDVNVEYPTRENFLFQTVIKYGDREVGLAAKAKLNVVSSKQQASAYVMAMAHNKFALYGVEGKKVYGLLNDPNLNASISPISITTGSTANSTWTAKCAAQPEKTANIVYNDINKLWAEISKNNGGLVDQNSRIILAVSNTRAPYLTEPNSFGLTAMTMLKQSFPNIEVVQLPELTTTAGEMLYMTVPDLFGIETGICAFSEKYFLGRVVPEMSSYKQKVVGGTWGAVIRRPSLVATMLGVYSEITNYGGPISRASFLGD